MAYFEVVDARYPVRQSGLGPYSHNGKLYAILCNAPSSVFNQNRFMQGWVSADAGTTWATVGTAIQLVDNNSDVGTIRSVDATYSVVVDPVNPAVLLVAYRDPASRAYLVSEWDMDNEDWGTTSDPGPVPDLVAVDTDSDGYYSRQAYFSLGISSTSGNIYVVAVLSYDQSTPSTVPITVFPRCYYATLSGGVAGTWSGAIRVPNQVLDPDINTSYGWSGNSYYPLGIVNGSSGRLHLFTAQIEDAAADTTLGPGICHFLLDDGSGNQGLAVDTVTDPDTLDTGTDTGSSTAAFGAASWVSGSTGLIFSYTTNESIDVSSVVVVYTPDDTLTSSGDWISIIAEPGNFNSPSNWGAGRDAANTVIFAYQDRNDSTRLLSRAWDGSTNTLGSEEEQETGTVDFNWWVQPTVVHLASVGVLSATSAYIPPPVPDQPPTLSGVAYTFFGSAPAPSIPVTPPPYGTRLIIRCPNYYDYCLHHERQTLYDIGMLRLLFPDFNEHAALNEPYTVIPTQGTQFKKQGYILLPTVEEVNTLVFSWRVPTGYDGSMWGILTYYTGQGYQEASEDLTFRFAVNRRFWRNLGSINVQLGSLAQYFPTEEHERLYSQQILNMYIYLGPGALSRLDPTKRIIMGMEGWIYPRGGCLDNPYRRGL